MKVISTYENCTRKAEVVLEDTGGYVVKFYIDNKQVQWMRFTEEQKAEDICEDFVISSSDDDMDTNRVLLNG